MAEHEKQGDEKGGVSLKDKDGQALKRPRMYRVLLHNDDFTPIGFVVRLVALVFRKSPEEAARITLEVHHRGVAVAGTYTHEVAETKRAIAENTARKHEHPLMVTMEPAP